MELFHCLYINLLLISSLFVAAVFSSDPYSEALLSLKSELIDDFNSLDDWLVPAGAPGKVYACSWSGVTCNKNSTIVVGLNLSMKDLGGVLSGKQFNVFNELADLNLSHNSFSGHLPVDLFNLTNLRSLDISRNNFSGHFPGGVLSGLKNLVVLDAFSNSFSGPLPVEASQLEYLKILNLAGSYFSGPIPSQYGSFQSLEFIHLAGNFLNGEIPAELGKLKTVTHMEIGYNSYQGSIPWQLGNMSEVMYLDIAGANLSGSIPKQLSNLTKLESLFLFRNQLIGMVPEEFSRISGLKSLDLSDNQLSGPIPESFSDLKNLRLLSLMYNEMSGTVPESLAQLPSLEILFIWNNYFNGSLPENLGRNSNLRWVDVSTNNFIGKIPPDICSRGVLFKLILFSNNFTASLSPSLSNCSSLVRLRLEDNSFSGEIPLNLPEITYIDLSNNKFTGGIPTDMSQAPKLQYLNLSNNPELGGNIPPQTWSLPLLQNFSASASNITGNLPPFKSCKSISVIELHKNHLSGSVPESISNCKALERIDLANNKLVGSIPEKLATLNALSVLDLSHNNLSGTIPEKFGNASNLLLLNVSFNDISGSIPSGKALKLMGTSAYVGNPRLCGAPLKPCPSSVSILGSKGTGKKLILVLLLCVGVVIFIAASLVGIFFFRRTSQGQWKMVSFPGLPRFTANDIMKSFNSTDSASVCKAVLPTGITVSVKKIEWGAKRMSIMSEFITRLGNARHKNLVRLLGFCYNKRLAYLLYDYLPNGNLAEKMKMKRDWTSKYKTLIGIGRGLCFLHHDCYPAIPHGDLKSSNIVFDENMEPHLAEFGYKYLIQLANGSIPATIAKRDSGEFNNAIREELCMDIYGFGEIIVEVLTNGRLTNAGSSIQNKPRDVVLREIYMDNEVVVGDHDPTNSLQEEEIKLVLDVALLCTKTNLSDRPSMEDALKLLSGLKPLSK